MDITVRRLQAGDETDARAVARRFGGATTPTDRATAFLAHAANYLIVAEVATDIVGFVLAYRLDRLDHPHGQLFVYEVEVVEAFRRQGIGRALMEYIHSVVRREQFLEAFVIANGADTAATALYATTGGTAEDEDGVVFVYQGTRLGAP